MNRLAALAALLLSAVASADVLVQNNSGSNYTLPPIYGGVTLTGQSGPGNAAVIADTKANVVAALGDSVRAVRLSQVPSGQQGAIVPLALSKVYTGTASTLGYQTKACVATPKLTDGEYFAKAQVVSDGPTGDGGFGYSAYEISGGFSVDGGTCGQTGATSAGLAVRGNFTAPLSAAVAFACSSGTIVVNVTSADGGIWAEHPNWACTLNLGPTATYP